jgi:hypothetical protein
MRPQAQWRRSRVVILVPGGGGTPWGSRAVFGGGNTSIDVNTIDYVEIATPGNAADFGDLTQARRVYAAASDGSRAVFGGGFTTVNVNTIDYVEIATPGNAVDFGDLTQARRETGATSGA